MITSSEPELTPLDSDAASDGEADARVVMPLSTPGELERVQEELDVLAERYRLFVDHSTEGIARIELRGPVDTSLDIDQ
jgi:hypothetical protein